MNLVKLDEQTIRKFMTSGIGFSRKQAEILNIDYPLKKGWLRSLIGKEIELNDYIRLIELKGKPNRSTTIKTICNGKYI